MVKQFIFSSKYPISQEAFDRLKSQIDEVWPKSLPRPLVIDGLEITSIEVSTEQLFPKFKEDLCVKLKSMLFKVVTGQCVIPDFESLIEELE